MAADMNERGEAAVNEEGCPSKVRPSAMLVDLVSARNETSEVFKTSEVFGIEVWLYRVEY